MGTLREDVILRAAVPLELQLALDKLATGRQYELPDQVNEAITEFVERRGIRVEPRTEGR